MASIPADAIHWDSGDWIDWHRNATPPDPAPCAAPSEDPLARLHTLRTRMLQCARAFHELSGQHLPIYEGIARVHAALAFDLPLDEDISAADSADQPCIIVIPPLGATDMITFDPATPCSCLIVVRIKDNFKAEARMMPCTNLPKATDGPIQLRWRDLPTNG
ncbi:hypothetical protein ACOTTU_02010 [Roseobacter sp. EG26]|uniref:hypothetical protein n=1 Tax=Roseobacter sp. EG26 TaxID=3412477 RepID=UPI003CE50F83